MAVLVNDYCDICLQCVLDRVWQWPFNAFTLDTVTGGKQIYLLRTVSLVLT
jgi:hypothetical protein